MFDVLRDLMDSINNLIYTKDKQIEKLEKKILALEGCNQFYLSLLKELEEKLKSNGIQPYRTCNYV